MTRLAFDMVGKLRVVDNSSAPPNGETITRTCLTEGDELFMGCALYWTLQHFGLFASCASLSGCLLTQHLRRCDVPQTCCLL